MKQAANEDLDSVQVVHFYFFHPYYFVDYPNFCLCDQVLESDYWRLLYILLCSYLASYMLK